MTYGSAVIVLGFIVMGAAVLSPMWSIGEDAVSYRRKRRRSSLVAVIAFVGLALLYFFADRVDHPPPPEPPPRVTGSNIEAEMIIPAPRPSGARAMPKGVAIEPSGFGMVLAAPASEHDVDPFSKAPPLPGLRLGDPAVAPEVAHLIRILPRVRPRAPSNWLGTYDLMEPPVVTGTVIMRDGCFRLAGKGEPLVLLPEYTRAVLDEAGYLVLGPPGTARAMAGRVGERMWWYGPTLQVTNAAVTGPLRKACGPGRVVRAGTSSDAMRRNEQDASTARSLSNMSGMSYDEARSEVAACQADADRRRAELRGRFGDDASKWPGDTAPGPCDPSPPPLVLKASDCPAGTTLSGGLCRNEKGFIVRVPPRPILRSGVSHCEGCMKTTKFKATVTAAALAALATGCSQSAGRTPGQRGAGATEPPRSERGASTAAAPVWPAGDVTDGNRAFGVALYRELATKQGNLFISPISIAGAFGPVIAGAEGETRTAIAVALRFPGNGGAELHPALGGLLRGLERQGDGATISIANALWLQQGFTVRPTFARIAREDYGATSETLDFVGKPVAAAARIDAWVDGETRGRISKLIPPSAFNERTRLVVTNAVYFLGDWAEPFRRSATQQQPFFVPGRAPRQVPLMSRRGQYRTIGTPEFQAIDLPYKDERLSMTVFLPQARDGLPAFEAGLSPERLNEWLKQLDAAQANKTVLYLPRLQIAEDYDLVKPLSAMGMGIAFTPNKAKFGGIADQDLYISAVAHKTFVRMDEKGTEAAAATGIVIEATSAPLLFRVDHPFFFVLRDKRSGAILFMGRIVEPGRA